MWAEGVAIISTAGCGSALGEEEKLPLQTLDRARAPDAACRARRLSCSAFFTSMAAILMPSVGRVARCWPLVWRPVYERLAGRLVQAMVHLCATPEIPRNPRFSD